MKSGWFIAFSSMWFATAMAVTAGLYFTHSIHCLWFMLIPTLISFRTKSGNKEDKDDYEQK